MKANNKWAIGVNKISINILSDHDVEDDHLELLVKYNKTYGSYAMALEKLWILNYKNYYSW